MDVAAAALGTGPFTSHGDKKHDSPADRGGFGFGEKSNGVVKTDQYPRESRACYQPRRPQTGVPLYQWGLMRASRSQPPHPTTSTSIEYVLEQEAEGFLPSRRGRGLWSVEPAQALPGVSAHTQPFRSSSTFSRRGLSMGPGQPGPRTAHDRWEVPMTPLLKVTQLLCPETSSPEALTSLDSRT